MSDQSEQILRICEMEAHLNQADAAVRTAEAALDALDAVHGSILALSDYYNGPLWRLDFEADEAGLLPSDLRRGVLSEDAVYNLLSDYDRLRADMQSFLQKT